MLLTELLGLPVLAGDERVGYVTDVRLVLDGPVTGVLARPRVYGLVVSPRTHSSFLGYERTAASSPRLVNAYLRWRHRGTVLVLWSAVVAVTADAVRLAPGHQRYDPAL
ncbi:PRC-barrel domain containing protein [Georgenia yuyongxinii]|uniref:PRC-barrel domain containing protein n=1 Tax=Georgenia yuyongxinii TaxID=2589797 RepID=A0A552WUS7_9MICO|nr:PRC-barrel domain containing protein [Georgenia yuyongxinii]TRW46524.1 PRC-barrel domain containing protein [Georgenia yuyongxinii]